MQFLFQCSTFSQCLCKTYIFHLYCKLYFSVNKFTSCHILTRLIRNTGCLWFLYWQFFFSSSFSCFGLYLNLFKRMPQRSLRIEENIQDCRANFSSELVKASVPNATWGTFTQSQDRTIACQHLFISISFRLFIVWTSSSRQPNIQCLSFYNYLCKPIGHALYWIYIG